MNRTDKKLMTMGSVIKSFRPNDLKKSIEKISSLVDSLDENVALKAALVIVEQCNGKAKQAVDVTSKGERITQPVVNVMSEEHKKKLLEFNKTLDAI